MNFFYKKNPFKKSPLDSMREGAEQIIIVPFNGMDVAVKVRCLNEVQVRSCGDFGVLDLPEDDSKKITPGKIEKDGLTDQKLVEIVNYHENLLTASLVTPTYEEIVDKVYGMDGWLKQARKELSEVEKTLAETGDSTEELEKRLLYNKRVNMLRMRIGYLLPMDFTATIVSWALGIDRTDIRKLTRRMLIRAASAAVAGHDNPTDHMDGIFTPFQKTEINITAHNLYNEEIELQREMSNGKKKGRTYNFFGKKPE